VDRDLYAVHFVFEVLSEMEASQNLALGSAVEPSKISAGNEAEQEARQKFRVRSLTAFQHIVFLLWLRLHRHFSTKPPVKGE